jgi:hypothetical protein
MTTAALQIPRQPESLNPGAEFVRLDLLVTDPPTVAALAEFPVSSDRDVFALKVRIPKDLGARSGADLGSDSGGLGHAIGAQRRVGPDRSEATRWS